MVRAVAEPQATGGGSISLVGLRKEFDGVTAVAVIGQILLDVEPPRENGSA
jgi:hypothetical protein